MHDLIISALGEYPGTVVLVVVVVVIGIFNYLHDHWKK